MRQIGALGCRGRFGSFLTTLGAIGLLAATTAEAQVPAPWTSTHVGDNASGPAGSASEAGGAFTINGSGADIWGTADEFQFVHQPWTGDVQVIARVVSQTNTDPWAKAGVMIRESTNANSIHAMGVVTPSNGVSFQRRTSTGGSSSSTTQAGFVAPIWLRIVRRGNMFLSYRSGDGVNWTFVGGRSITMTASVQVGMAVTSHNDTLLSTAVFDNVTVSAPPGAGSQTPVPTGSGPGLTGEYHDITGSIFPSPSFPTGAPAVTRIDPYIDFYWGSGAGWVPGGPADYFAVRWSGSIEPRYSGAYTFYTESDDGVRLWLDYQPIIDNWTDHSATINAGTITLQAGWRYNLVMEFYENAGDALARLLWESFDGQAFQIVPSTQFFTFSTPAGGQPGPYVGGGGGGVYDSDNPNGNDGINDACWGGSSIAASPAPVGLLPALLGLTLLFRRRRV